LPAKALTGPTVRSRLTLMALSLVAPAVVLMVLLAWTTYRQSQQRYEQQLIATTRALAVATDRQIGQGQITLKGLATSPALRAGDFKAFEAQARDAIAGRPAWIVLAERNRQILNTRAAPGASPPPRGPSPEVWAELEKGETTISNLRNGALVRRPVVGIHMPVIINGQLHALSFVQEPSAFESLFRAQGLPPTWTGAILDRNAVLLARSRASDQMRGRKASPDLRAAMARSGDGVVLSRTLDGTPTLSAFSRSDDYGWTFVVGVPRREVFATAWGSVIGLSAATGTLLILGLLLALAFSRQISRQVRSLAQDAMIITDNQIVGSQANDLSEIAQVREALHRASMSLRAREDEQAAAAARQNVMINELNHRVKNTLAMVQSLARQSLAKLGPEPAIDAFTERLVALSEAHDLLTERTWQNADLGEVVARTLAPYGERARRSGPAVTLSPNSAVTLSMVFHELATNAVKYGAFSNQNGRVDVLWSQSGAEEAQSLTIVWRERGGPPVRALSTAGFGSKLINASIRHEFGGAVQVEPLPSGLCYSFILPVSPRLTGQAA
jgi:two-component sensor histidine kinase